LNKANETLHQGLSGLLSSLGLFPQTVSDLNIPSEKKTVQNEINNILIQNHLNSMPTLIQSPFFQPANNLFSNLSLLQSNINSLGIDSLKFPQTESQLPFDGLNMSFGENLSDALKTITQISALNPHAKLGAFGLGSLISGPKPENNSLEQFQRNMNANQNQGQQAGFKVVHKLPHNEAGLSLQKKVKAEYPENKK